MALYELIWRLGREDGWVGAQAGNGPRDYQYWTDQSAMKTETHTYDCDVWHWKNLRGDLVRILHMASRLRVSPLKCVCTGACGYCPKTHAWVIFNCGVATIRSRHSCYSPSHR